MRGAQLAGGSLSPVLVTGDAGSVGRRKVPAPLDEGHEGTPTDQRAAEPRDDFQAGIATVWPESSETAK